jgi:hypothetical protein
LNTNCELTSRDARSGRSHGDCAITTTSAVHVDLNSDLTSFRCCRKIRERR